MSFWFGFRQYFQKEVPARFDPCPDPLFVAAYNVKYSAKRMKKWEKEYTALKTKEQEDQEEVRVLLYFIICGLLEMPTREFTHVAFLIGSDSTEAESREPYASPESLHAGNGVKWAGRTAGTRPSQSSWSGRNHFPLEEGTGSVQATWRWEHCSPAWAPAASQTHGTRGFHLIHLTHFIRLSINTPFFSPPFSFSLPGSIELF